MDRDRTPGVPLSHYLTDHKGVRVRFTCLSCMAHHDVEMEAVVERLKARGLGDERTGIREVGRLGSAPCRRCGGTVWETTPAFPVGPKAP